MFSTKPARGVKPVSAPRSSAGSTFSVLGADTAIRGDICASADLHIDGKVEGDISCASLVQGQDSEVHGNISAETARLSGAVHGSIAARELVILKSAHIHGNVQYDALTIEQGAMVEGQLSPRGALPAVETEAAKGEDLLILSQPTD